jgi:hypothetical protein
MFGSVKKLRKMRAMSEQFSLRRPTTLQEQSGRKSVGLATLGMTGKKEENG